MNHVSCVWRQPLQRRSTENMVWNFPWFFQIPHCWQCEFWKNMEWLEPSVIVLKRNQCSHFSFEITMNTCIICSSCAVDGTNEDRNITTTLIHDVDCTLDLQLHATSDILCWGVSTNIDFHTAIWFHLNCLQQLCTWKQQQTSFMVSFSAGNWLYRPSLIIGSLNQLISLQLIREWFTESAYFHIS